MALITYEMAVKHLKQDGVLDGTPEDSDLRLKMEQASALVLVYLQRPAEWDVDSDPTDDPEFAIVQAAVLRVLGNLYRFRGDDEVQFATVGNNPLGPEIIAMLAMLRDPAIA